MHESIERMLTEIAGQGTLFTTSRKDLTLQCQAIVKQLDLDRINKVYIAGCGDSWYVGNNTRDLFLKYAKLHTEAWQALDFSGYICNYEVDDRSLVICISNSGNVSRTAECALRAKAKGATVVGYTSRTDSPLAKAVDHQVFTTILTAVPQAGEEGNHIPGTYSYTASMMGLVCMAIALGEGRGVLSAERCEELYAYIEKLGECIRPTVETCNKQIERYADVYIGADGPCRANLLHFLGSGPNWGVAQYASEKMLESAAFDAVCQGIEEWAHTQYFTTRPTTHTVIIAPRGASRRRALEITQAVTVMDGKKLIIGEENDKELRRAADIYLPICGMDNIEEAFSPLLYSIPVMLLSMHLGRALGRQAFSFDKPWVQEENLRQIWDSEITMEEENA